MSEGGTLRERDRAARSSSPSAGTIDIHYVLVPHTDRSRPAAGTIVPNPGGPGDSATAQIGLYTQAMAPLLRRRDLLLIDVRGTGQSGALGCRSMGRRDPLSLDLTTIGSICGAELGRRAGLYGSAAAADDIDAVRAKLGLDKLDLWGDSYGTFLMPVYAARHPDHVRSVVLDGAFPIAFDPWGRDVLRGVRRAIGLACERSRRCSSRRVLAQMSQLATRLRRDPVNFTAHSPAGRVRLTLGERELADLTVAGDPAVFGLLPAAVDAALDDDLALLDRLVTVSRINEVRGFVIDPRLFSVVAGAATSCHDYPRPYDLAAAPATRRAEYQRALARLDPAQFRPFSARAWLGTGIDAGPKCLYWPADPTAGSPLEGRPIPDVPVLVQSGDLDTVTPIEQGRRAAAQFAHSIYGIVANAGHTPDLQPCGVAMALDFVEHLKTNPSRCLRAGSPPTVIGRPARHAAQLPLPRARASVPIRRAIAVVLATIADAQAIAEYSGLTGTLDALRGGTYVVGPRGARVVDARVVTDATADGTLEIGPRSAKARFQLRGRGVQPSNLTLQTVGRRTRITGTVGGQRVALLVAT